VSGPYQYPCRTVTEQGCGQPTKRPSIWFPPRDAAAVADCPCPADRHACSGWDAITSCRRRSRPRGRMLARSRGAAITPSAWNGSWNECPRCGRSCCRTSPSTKSSAAASASVRTPRPTRTAGWTSTRTPAPWSRPTWTRSAPSWPPLAPRYETTPICSPTTQPIPSRGTPTRPRTRSPRRPPRPRSSSTLRADGITTPASSWSAASTSTIPPRASATAAAARPRCGTTLTRSPRSTGEPPPTSHS